MRHRIICRNRRCNGWINPPASLSGLCPSCALMLRVGGAVGAGVLMAIGTALKLLGVL